MRRVTIYILLVAALLMAVPCFAQPRLRTAEMQFGIHGGVIASMMYFTPKVEAANQLLNTVLLGGNGGFVFRYTKHKYFGLQVELNYLQRGWREKISASDMTDGGRYTRQLHYLEIPFLMHLYFGKRHWRGFFNLGPEIGYCIADTWTGTQHPVNNEQYKPIDHPFDWGITGGLGFYYRKPRIGVFQLEARFMFSLGDTFANRSKDYFSQSHAMNLSLNLGYLWEFQPKPKTKTKNTL